MNKFKDAILIVSHPDDECLFASSLLDKISTLVICFNDIPKEDLISKGRKKAIKTYPLKNIKVINLDLCQAKESFIPLNWFNIKDSPQGILGGYKTNSYELNYKNIILRLKKIIPKNSLIITHNPWGEYGHSEHCQLFKASFEVACEKKATLFVNGYISNLSRYYANRKLFLLKNSFYKIKTNPKIYKLLRDHYRKYNCWTWYKEYRLPFNDLFYEINLKSDPRSFSENYNYINYELNHINHINPLIYFIRSIIKKLLPFYIKNFFRKGRISYNKK